LEKEITKKNNDGRLMAIEITKIKEQKEKIHSELNLIKNNSDI